MRRLLRELDALARELLREYVRAVPGLAIVCECTSGDEVAEGLMREPVDVALLDIRMPGADVFSVLAQAASRRPLPPVIFSTAYDRYAVRAFELNAVDYLVKPYAGERFAEAIRRVRQSRVDEQSQKGLERVIRDLGPRPDRLLVPDGRRMVPLEVASIGWIKAEGDYARVYAGGRSYLVSRTLKDLEGRLDPVQFLRIHRSAIVQTSHIREVRPEGSSRYRVVVDDGTTLIVSRSRVPELKRWML